ncbi:hypothetical protein CEXT_62361 [Caerostris extrusa]|uniref:Secreted protein n=1 Tax=Caerostris extrusa TaxID=172846 RepID=A0AAV4XUB5_CAEEX|nr:hypothetical protein CEXT_62361 [Caerostris extrusa]
MMFGNICMIIGMFITVLFTWCFSPQVSMMISAMPAVAVRRGRKKRSKNFRPLQLTSESPLEYFTQRTQPKLRQTPGRAEHQHHQYPVWGQQGLSTPGPIRQ